jgi:hypothetical protein
MSALIPLASKIAAWNVRVDTPGEQDRLTGGHGMGCLRCRLCRRALLGPSALLEHQTSVPSVPTSATWHRTASRSASRSEISSSRTPSTQSPAIPEALFATKLSERRQSLPLQRAYGRANADRSRLAHLALTPTVCVEACSRSLFTRCALAAHTSPHVATHSSHTLRTLFAHSFAPSLHIVDTHTESILNCE